MKPTQEKTMEWEDKYPLNTFKGETKKEIKDFISFLLISAKEQAYEKGWNDAVKSKNKTISILMEENKLLKIKE